MSFPVLCTTRTKLLRFDSAMVDSEAFENSKKEIRSILLTYQKGCTLSEFRSEYKKLLGQELPTTKFNFRNDVELLKAIPDTVKMYPSGRDYHLMGVADANTKHIQKMVSNQKPSKPKPLKHKPLLQPPRYTRYSQPLFIARPQAITRQQKCVPPRFRTSTTKKLLPPDLECNVVSLVRKFSTGLCLADFFTAYLRYYNSTFSFKEHGFYTLEECLETIPDLSMRSKSNEIFIYYVGGNRSEISTKHSMPFSVPASANSHTAKLIDFNSFSKQEATQSLQKDKASKILSLNESCSSASRTEGYRSASKTEGYMGTENRCLEQSQYASNSRNFEQADKQKCSSQSYNFQNIPSVKESSQYYQENAMYKNSLPSKERLESPKSKADRLDTFELGNVRTSDVGVSENVKRNLREVMARNRNGVWATDFPSIYEDVTGSLFDLHSLGFTDLASLIDVVPDICRKIRKAGMRKDWIVCPTALKEEDVTISDPSPKVGNLLIDCTIQSIRKILQGCPEGILLSEFFHVYSTNCNEPLYIDDLGFDSIENFLGSISDRVPLRIESKDGCKTVFLNEIEEVCLPSMGIYEENMKECIPFDAASQDCRYKLVELPEDFDASVYFPVYTSDISHPGHFFVQLHGQDTSEALSSMYDDMDKFYNGPYSQQYQMKSSHIKERAMCAAFWPNDKHWYRAQVISVTSSDSVKVFYVDYGTRDEIPKTLLRYLKEVYSKMPAQALKAHLAHLKPSNKATKWTAASKKRMLELCHDVRLMAKVEAIKDGALSLILCDTNGEENDIYINDILMKEGFADSIMTENEPDPQVPQQAFTPLQVMQAQYYWLTFKTLSLTMTPEDVTKAMQSLCIDYPDNPLISRQRTVSPSNSMMGMSPPNTNILQNNPLLLASAASVLPVMLSSTSVLPSMFSAQENVFPNQTPKMPLETELHGSSPPLSPCASSDESDIFQDDDGMFEEFYQKASTVSKRYVKRIKTEDGYFFHILIVESEPYVSSGDISALIWNDKNPDYLLQRLQNRDTVFPSLSLSEEGNEQMFQQFEKFHVKGTQNVGDSSSILIYPLKSAIAILNMYGHPSAELRRQIMNEIATFNPQLPTWQELSEVEIPESEEEEFRAVTDDDKLKRLCIYDLMAMKDGIRCRRNKLVTNLDMDKNRSSTVDELKKLENLLQRVVVRIQEIQQICTMFV